MAHTKLSRNEYKYNSIRLNLIHGLIALLNISNPHTLRNEEAP